MSNRNLNISEVRTYHSQGPQVVHAFEGGCWSPPLGLTLPLLATRDILGILFYLRSTLGISKSVRQLK